MRRRVGRVLLCLALAVCGALAMFLSTDLDENAARTFSALIATIAGTLLGFAMTSLAILVSVGDSKLLNNAKKVGFYKNLIRGIYAAAAALFLTMAASVALFFHVSKFSTAAIVFLFVLSLVLMFSVGRKFFAVLEIMGEPKGDGDNID